MSTNIVCFHGEIRQIFSWDPVLSLARPKIHTEKVGRSNKYLCSLNFKLQQNKYYYEQKTGKLVWGLVEWETVKINSKYHKYSDRSNSADPAQIQVSDWLSWGFMAQSTHKGHVQLVSLPNHTFPGQA